MPSDSADDASREAPRAARVFVPPPDGREPQQRLADRLMLLLRAAESQARRIRCAIIVHDPSLGCLKVAAAPSLDGAYCEEVGQITVETGDEARRNAWSALQALTERHHLRASWFVALNDDEAVPAGYLVVYAHHHTPGEREWRLVRDTAALAAMLLASPAPPVNARASSIALAVDSSRTGVWDSNLISGEIYYSAAWKAMLGYADHEIGTRIEDAHARLHPADLPVVRSAIDAHLAGKTDVYAVEHRIRCKDGSYKWISSRGKVVSRDGDGNPLRMAGISNDISDLMALSDSLRHYVDGLTKLTNDMPGLIFQCFQLRDGSAFMPYASAGIAQMFELAPEQVAASIGPITDRIHPDDLPGFQNSLRECARRTIHWNVEFRVILPQQGECWRQADAQPYRLPDGGTLWHGMISDITDRKTMASRLHDLVATDFLTGLTNRNQFMLRMGEEHQRLRDAVGIDTTLLMFDIDHFKQVNATYGYAIGDLVLQHFAAILRIERRRVDAGGRLSGEQFALLLVGASVQEATMLARRVAERLARAPFSEGDLVVPVTASVGIASLRADDESIHQALARADRALYLAKELGRNRIELAADK